MSLLKIYNVIKIAQDLLKVIVPVLETIIQKDINGDGTVGKGV